MINAATAATEFVTINGDRIAYRKFGSGSPLILANRMRGTLDTWDPLFLDQLAASHTVIIFDYPGIGYSSGVLPQEMGQVAAFLRAFAHTLGIAKFAMGGWSWGGFLAQTLAVESPELVTHAILIGTNPVGHNEYPIKQVFLDRALKPINDLEDEETLFFEPASERSRLAAKQSRERIHAARPDLVAKIPSKVEEIVQFLKAAEIFQADGPGRREQLTRSQLPMLIICGDNDPSTQTPNWYALVGRIPRGQLIVLPEAGHGPQHQYPVLSAKYIADFIEYAAQ
jgi:pimeloyl-ACP methyl ester carboxylesterase